MATTKTDVG